MADDENQGTASASNGEAQKKADADSGKLPVDFYYEPSAVGEPAALRGELPRDLYALDASFGFDLSLRNNLHYVGEGADQALVFATGNCVHLVKIASGQVSYMFGHNTGGVSALTVHPKKKNLFVTGEKGTDPHIVVYDYPSLRPYRILRKGTEAMYSDLCFSSSGDKLASVGSFPDYMLTVWDWMNEKIILRTKAFAQEVYNVRFSPFDEGSLTTSGMGHIRFWKMAKTFTGLKLQGAIGKFGRFDLSDISAFSEFEDGKILSGSEIGQLLLWEGNFIKIEVGRPDGGLAHDGEIHFVKVDHEAGQVITAGDDGALRFWALEPIDVAEASDENPRCEIEPIKTIQLAEGTKIRSVLRGSDHWLLLAASGILYRLDDIMSDGRRAKELMKFHAGAINGLAASPLDHFSATAGEDGSVRCWDYVDRMCLFDSHFPSSASAIAWAPTTVDPEARTIAVGFATGVVRVLYRAQRQWKVLIVTKPNNSRIQALSYSPDGKYLVSAGLDQRIFFLKAVKSSGQTDSTTFSYEPVGFVQFSEERGSASFLSWRDDSCAVLCSCSSSGEAVEIGVPGTALADGEAGINTEESFNITATCKERVYTFTAKPDLEAMQRKAAAASEEEKDGDLVNPFERMEEDTLTISRAIYVPSQQDRILVTVCSSLGKYEPETDSTTIHECVFGEEYASDQIASHSKAVGSDKVGTTQFLGFSHSRKLLLSGGGDGTAMVRCVTGSEGGGPLGSAGTGPGLPTLAPFFANINMHDSNEPGGTLTGVCTSFDDKYVLTSGKQGAFFSLRLRYPELEKAAQQAADGKARELAARAAKASLFSTATATEELGATSMDEVFGSVSSSVPGDFHDDGKESKIVEAKEIDKPEEAYSIEDAKLKTEEDARRALAEINKNKQREKIADLRSRYMLLVEANAKLPKGQQLSSEEIQLDPSVKLRLIAQGDAKCEEVEKVMRWESEKLQLAVEKLRKRFLSTIAVEGISMKTFKTGISVRSFRTETLPDSLQEALRAVHALIDAEEDARRRIAIEQKNGSSKTGDGNGKSSKSKSRKLKGDPGSEDSEGKKVDDRTQEGRKELRAMRKEELDAMMSRKPNLNEEDPDDVAAIEYTQQNLGDYKLKTSKDYVVPEDLRVNAEKKRRQMVLLEESVHAIKMGYNQRFLALRDLKKRIIENIGNDNARVREIDRELGNLIEAGDEDDAGGNTFKFGEVLWQPKLDSSEWPEERFKVSEEELNQQAEAANVKISSDSKNDSAVAGSKSKGKESKLDSSEQVQTASEIDQIPQLKAASSIAGTFEGSEGSNVDSGEGDSERENALREERKIVLLHERKVLLEKTSQTAGAFDEAMYDLCREKLKLDADLKTAEMRMLTFFGELEMLKDFEKKDKLLSAKLEKANNEKASMATEISECHTKLEAKRAEIEVWQQKDKAIHSEFSDLVPESNALYPQLLKIFKRKIKRSKKVGAGGGDDGEGSGDDSDYESSDYDESDDDGDSDDDEDEDDSCPAGCDQAMYDKVLELREKRLDQEDILADFQKNIDDLKKNHDRLAARERQINKELVSTKKDIELFQTEKQRKLNTLDVYVTVQLSQILHLISSSEWYGPDGGGATDGRQSMPGSPMGRGSPMRRTMSETASVFSSTMGGDSYDVIPEYVLQPSLEQGLLIAGESIQKLRHRIVEIGEETQVQDKKFRNLHKEKKMLFREKKVRKKRIEAQEEKCNDLQMLKFGQTIDLESLDKMGSRQALDKVNQKKRKLEVRQEAEVVKMKREISSAQENLIETTQENTVQLERIAQLTQQQQTLERDLNAGGSGSGGDNAGIMRRDVEERNRLVQLVKLQAKEVDALKAEINMLRRKGGHVYTPAVSTSPSRGVQSGLHGVSAGSLGMESGHFESPPETRE